MPTSVSISLSFMLLCVRVALMLWSLRIHPPVYVGCLFIRPNCSTFWSTFSLSLSQPAAWRTPTRPVPHMEKKVHVSNINVRKYGNVRTGNDVMLAMKC